MQIPGSTPTPLPAGSRPKEPESSSKSDLPSRFQLGRYCILRRIGQGGMGVVYEAEDSLLRRRVALKVLPKAVAMHQDALTRFRREGQGAAKLNHAHVVTVFDVGEVDGVHFIVMELVEGGSIQDHLELSGAFSWVEATRILADVCRGVSAAHQVGLVHRDIKPSNILRSRQGVIKLGDFGLVKWSGQAGTNVTASGAAIGTPSYMSPEQIQNGLVDERSDVYSLGATYFALLTGQPPYQASEPAQVLFAQCGQAIPDPRDSSRSIPEACTEMVRRAMSKSRAERYPSAEHLLVDLEKLLSTAPHEPAKIPIASPIPRLGRADSSTSLSLAEAYPGEQTQRNARPILSARKWVGLMLILATIVLAVWLWNNRDITTRPFAESPDPKLMAENEDWASVLAVAERAIRHRSAKELNAALGKIEVLIQRVSGEKPGQMQAMVQTQYALKKALAFRQSITEKGLVIGLGGQVSQIAVAPDDRWLALGLATGDGGVVIWDLRTGERLPGKWSHRGPTQIPIQSVAISHDSAILAAGCGDGRDIKIWRRDTEKVSSLKVAPNIASTQALAFSPTRLDLVAGFEPLGEGRGRPYLQSWNLMTGEEAFPFKHEHSASIRTVTYCTGGQQLASGSKDKRVVMWNAETGRIWRELRTGMVVQSIATGLQGRLLAAAGENAEGSFVQFWDYVGERKLAQKASPFGPCRCVAFSRDGGLLATGSGERILLWNPETLEVIATLTGHSELVTTLAFLGEGGILASGSQDQSLRLWDIQPHIRLAPK